MRERALVLGGGGVTGVAWEIGLLHGLAERGVDLTGADLVLGSSAGSIVGASVAAGRPLDVMYQGQLEAPAPESESAPAVAASLGVAVIARMIWVTVTSRDPARARARIGKMALAADTESEADQRRVIAARLPAEWPDRPLQVTAVDAGTGELTVFDAASGVPLVDAVGASCAVPGVWPPVTIGERRFIDGGIRSPANADLAKGYGQVVIVAPIIRGMSRQGGVRWQAAALAAAGARVAVIGPDAAATAAIGRNVLDPARRAPAARAGYAQASSVVEQVAAVWQAQDAGPKSVPPG
jgi:NTE family protein